MHVVNVCLHPPLYTKLVQTQAVCATVTLDHSELVELLFARRCPAANVPLLAAHDLVEAVRRAV
jgi:predicted solute-binding protein